MPVKKRTKRVRVVKNNKGIISLLIVFVVVVLAFLISGVVFENSTTPTPQEGILDYKRTTNSSKSLQEQAIHFLTPTPTPGQSFLSGSGKNIVWLNSYSSGEFAPHFTDWVWAQCGMASM